MEWDLQDFVIPPEFAVVLPQPPSSRHVGEVSKWYNHFKQLEEWLRGVAQKYDVDVAFFYQHAPSILHVAFSAFHAAKAIYALNPERFISREVDKRLWKCAVQDIIAVIRHKSRNPTQAEVYFRGIVFNRFLDKMVLMFIELVQMVEKTSGLDLEAARARRAFVPDYDDKFLSDVVDLVYRVRIYIGDLYRYHTPNQMLLPYALESYDIARFLRLNNGRAYYQIGVLCIITDNSLAALYHFVRALDSDITIERAKSDILEIYDKAFKEHLAKRSTFWYHLSKRLEDAVKLTRKFKGEIWILSNPIGRTGVPRPVEIPPPTKKEHLSAMSPQKIFSRFSLTFSLVVGKLFSRIGMDEFELVAEEALVYFEGVLCSSTHGNMDFISMMHVVGLTIFMLTTAVTVRLKATDSPQRDQAKQNLKLAALFTLELFSIAVERLSKLVYLMDWDNPQVQTLSAAVMVWSLWLWENRKVWAISHARPKFCARRVERIRNHNRSDTTDDVWAVFGQLLERIEIVLTQGREYVFPKTSFLDEHISTGRKMTKLKEYYILNGLLQIMDSKWYTNDNFVEENGDESRAHILLRLHAIHSFGVQCVTEKLQYLKKSETRGRCFYSCSTKLIMPRELKDACGLGERNYWFWVMNNERLKVKPRPSPHLNRPDCNGALTLVRKKGSKLMQQTSVFRREVNDFPVSDTNKVWCSFHDLNYRCDMVVIARRLVIDTNCYISKLAYVERLVKKFPYPIILPITVLLELKGLSKGCKRKKERGQFNEFTTENFESIKHGNEVAICALEALDFIEKNLRCFRMVTQKGRIFKVASIYSRIADENFDPTVRNDNKILEACVFLELNDKHWRRQDTPFRLYRRTVLVTNDRGLSVKSIVYEIPTKDIESVTLWVDRLKKVKKSSSRENHHLAMQCDLKSNLSNSKKSKRTRSTIQV